MSTKDEIFDYVMHSPENTNPAVLGSMLNGLESEDTGDTYYVNVTQVKQTVDEEDSWSLDKSVSEIFAAYRNGKQVVAKITYYGESYPRHWLCCTGLGIVELNEGAINSLSFEWVYTWNDDYRSTLYLNIFETTTTAYGDVYYYE